MSFKPLGAAAPLNGCPSVQEFSDGAALFIIDPQVDFHEGGSLAVTGANGDSDRIAELIKNNMALIDHIYVSLDSHHRMHIAHGAFWKDKDGAEPAPFTEILAADVESGKFKAADPAMQEWALKYCKALEAGGRFKHLIWPYHCLVGTPGHAVHPGLMSTLNTWSKNRSRAITWVLKGQNNHTEMYSALKAEVPVPGDPTTELNTQLIADLASHSKVIECGEEKSHCVNYTTRDLVSGWPKTRKYSDIVLLEDGTCPVAGFEEAANTFFKEMETQGVSFVKAEACAGLLERKEPTTQMKLFTPVGAAATLNGCPSVKEGVAGAALFIIDPQVDFHEGGSLEVTGATGDSERIAGLITKNIDKIDHIYVSLDSHHQMHISHGDFWQDTAGKAPAPFTEILAADVESGKYKAADLAMQEWALKYCKALEAGGRFKHFIWPYHCLVGTPGHAVAPALMPALDTWSQQRGRAITWVLKGQNNHTEMYSALKAEVPVPGDSTTELNTQLIADLASHSQVIVCGEAKSHCVNYTTRDLVSGWPTGRPCSDIVLLSDGTCPVGNFEKAADEFFADMEQKGVSIVKAAEWVPKA